jgi:hypothetical protein
MEKIYDTPGLFDTQDGHDVIKAEIDRAIQMASPGPHAFIILFKIGNRFTDEEKKTIALIFSRNMIRYPECVDESVTSERGIH